MPRFEARPPDGSLKAMQATSTSSLERLASGAKQDRNRAVDLYRAVAMLAVALGHWLVMVAYREDGELISGNALEFVPDFQLATWVFQVMPLFFVVGGFASAASLDSKGLGRQSTGAQRADWIAGRLARLLPPVAALAAATAAGAGPAADNRPAASAIGVCMSTAAKRVAALAREPG